MNIPEIDRLVSFPINSQVSNLKQLKYTNALKKEFGKEFVSNREISLSIKSGLIPLEFVSEILVDSYQIKERYLYKHITNLSAINSWDGYKEYYHFRESTPDNISILKDIANLLSNGEIDLTSLPPYPDTSMELLGWADVII